MLKGDCINLTSIKKLSKRLFLTILICSSMFLALNQFKFNQIRGHSTLAMPKEIYSLFNETIVPTIDGTINFNATKPNLEWASAAIYDMYGSVGNPRGKVLIQNDDTYLYVAMDMIDHEDPDPIPTWGALIYFDVNNNGLLDSADRCFRFLRDMSDIESVDFCKPNSAKNDWDIIQSKARGELLVLSTGNATMNSLFTTSYFDKTNSHRQYEFRVSLDAISKTPGELFGIGFEATIKFDSASGSVLWPHSDALTLDYRVNPKYWGDISLGKDGEYIKYVIKENFNIKDGAVGFNNRTFVRSGDIDGDGYEELIAFSNRTVVGDTNLMAIYDVESGSIVEKWNSWDSSFASTFSLIKDISCFDFNDDGKDEIYLAMDGDYNIYRLSEWNSLGGDFDYFDTHFYVFDMTINNIAIGDATNDNDPDIVVGFDNGWFAIGTYKNYGSDFTVWLSSYFHPWDIDGKNVIDIEDILIADMDRDAYYYDEILMLLQNADGTTGLEIFEADDYSSSIYDNPTDHPTWGWEDDLPYNSHSNTFDDSGHTILVEDVDNDDEVETIIVGNDYVKIFGRYSFNDSSIPLVFDINDETFENMSGGGAGILDINGDSLNELVVSCNNGTTLVYQIVDLNSDPDVENLLPILQWTGDIGTSPGSRSSIIGLDIDGDSIDDAIIGDDFGQILVLGLGPSPELTITKPSYDGYTSVEDTFLIQWNTSSETLQIHHYEIYVNGQITFRIGGGQIGALISLDLGLNTITVICTDICGETDYASRQINYDPGAPTVTITSPENYFLTSTNEITISWDEYDPGNDLEYYVYANGTEFGPTTDTILPIILPSEGVWNITVFGSNPGGDKAKDMIYVIYDNSAPVISITLPDDYTAVKSDSVIISWTASDLYSEIVNFTVYRDGLRLYNTTLYSFEVDLPTEKVYTIRVDAFDELGHSSNDIVHVIKDITNPIVDLAPLSYPINSDGWYYTDSSDLFIEWTGSDNYVLGSFEVWVEEDLYGIYPITAINDTVTLSSEGPNDIVVIAYDEAGNSASDQYTVALDTSDPFIDIISPYDFYTTGADNITINWDTFDNGAGIEEIEIFVNSTSQVIFSDPFPDSYLIDLPENKTYEITVLVTDYLDNTAQDTIHVIHDPTQPAVYFTNPIEIESYTNTTDLFISWSISNLIPEQFIIYVNTTTEYYYTTSTRNAIIDLEEALLMDIDQYTYPIANITIVAVVGGVPLYFDTRFVLVDIGSPNLQIDKPNNLTTIIIPSFTIEWSGSDFGSGIAKYIVKINETIIGEWSSTKTSQFVDASSFEDGTYKITVEAYDKAGNVKIKTHYINIYLTAPEFSINISNSILTNDPNFNLGIDIYNTGLGISEVIIIADGEKLAYINDFNGSYQISPIVLVVSIEEKIFIALSDEHNLSITVYDYEGHSSNDFVDILVDKQSPQLVSNPIIDNVLLGSSGHSIEISDDIADIHNFTLTFNEENGIVAVQLIIYNENISYSYFMIKNEASSSGAFYFFEASINFDDYEAGLYNIQFIILDMAGNSLSETYTLLVTIEIVETPTDTPTTTPSVSPNWFIEHLFTIIIPASSGVILIALLSALLAVMTKRRVSNKGWQDVIEAVAYVTKTGLTTCYVPYTKDLFEDEQLFGGALTGIVGILGEITGESSIELNVQVMEYGGKSLMICPGLFGNSILLVTDEKPILKELLRKFTLEYELTFKNSLVNELVNLNDFDAAPKMAESYFGPRKRLGEEQETETDRFEDLASPLEDSEMFYEDNEEEHFISDEMDDLEEHYDNYTNYNEE